MRARAVKMTKRFDWFYNPLIVALVSLAVGLFDRGKYRFLLSLAAVLPLLILYVAAGSFNSSTFLFGIAYFVIAILVAFAIPVRNSKPANHLQGV